MTILLDTDVLIDHFRGIPSATDLLLELVADELPPAISVITLAEIEAGIREPERVRIEALLSSLQVLPVSTAVAHLAGQYRAGYGQSHGVLLPDALIAATAVQHDCTLYTLNRKHYPMPELRIVVPYKKGSE